MKQQNFLFNKTNVTSDNQTKNEDFLVETVETVFFL